MPRAEDSEPAEQVNPARRSRFSVAWLFGTSGSGADRADHDLNDSLLNAADDNEPGAPLFLRTLQHRVTACCCGGLSRCGGGKRKPLCGCCVLLAVSVAVWLLLLYQAYGDLMASLPDLAIHPVHVTGLCAFFSCFSSISRNVALIFPHFRSSVLSFL